MPDKIDFEQGEFRILSSRERVWENLESQLHEQEVLATTFWKMYADKTNRRFPRKDVLVLANEDQFKEFLAKEGLSMISFAAVPETLAKSRGLL